MEEIGNGVSWIGIWLASGLYKIAMAIFELFLVLASGKLVDTNDFKVMVENFYVLIGVVMLFIIAFFLLKAMINPDDQSKSNSSIKKIIMNLITSLIIIAVLPTVFTFMFDFQDSMLKNYNVIGKFFGYGSLSDNSVEGNSYDQIKSGSYKLVNSVFTAFFNVDPDACTETDSNGNLSKSGLESCQANIKPEDTQKTSNFYEAIKLVDKTGKISLYYDYSNAANKHGDATIDFDFLMSLVAGAVLLYVGISYCLDMGVRLVKLVFYQIIAPIPTLLRIVPEGKLSGIFNQWLKVTLSCYFEVYIRIFVFYFCIYLADAMTQPGAFLEAEIYNYGPLLAFLARAFTFMGLVMFMKQAPKLISEITGIDSGNMKLGIKDKLKDAGFFAAANAVGGLISSGGNPLAAVRGFKHGWNNSNFKGIGAEHTRKQAWEDASGKGARRRDLIKDDIRAAFGFETTAEAAERRVRQGKLPGNKRIVVTNTSGSDITFGDGEKDFIKKDGEIEVNDKVKEKWDARIKSNENKMAPTETRIKELEKAKTWVSQQKSLKDAFDADADKKWKDEKFSTEVWYQDKNGNIFNERIYEERFTELSKKGVKFLKSGDGIRYVDYDGKKYSLSELKANGFANDNDIQKAGFKIDETTLDFVEKNNDIRDKMRQEYQKAEQTTDHYNLMVGKVEEFFEDLAKNSFEYKTIVMEGGKIKKNDKGEFVKYTGNFSYDKNTEVLQHEEETATGTVKTEYRNLGNGIWEKKRDGVVENVDIYYISDLFDKKAKDGLNTINKDIQVEQLKIQDYKEENENLQELIKQYEKNIADELDKPYFRAYRASNDYRNKNKH